MERDDLAGTSHDQLDLPAYDLRGEIAQVVTVSLEQGQGVWASRGSIMSYPDTISWRVGMPGGVGSSVQRVMAGESFTLCYVEATTGPGHVVLAPSAAGKIAVWDLRDGPVIATRGAFLAAVGEIQISVTLARRAGALFFGGAGVLLQTISGRGLVFVHGSGDFFDYRLEAGQNIMVSTGNLAAFSQSIDYSIRGVGGCFKMLLGGEGIFMTSLTGPGRVLLQTLKRGVSVRRGSAE